MTRDEAIKELKEYEDGLDLEYATPFDKAILYAIKAIEQEPTTKNDLGVDCISRADVLKLMQDNWHTHNGDWAMQESMDDIRALPSVTPQEPKTGHWIGTRRVGCGFGEYKEYIVPIKDGIVTDSCHCSECGEWLTGSDEYECYGNYCPNCGAKMESEDKE